MCFKRLKPYCNNDCVILVLRFATTQNNAIIVTKRLQSIFCLTLLSLISKLLFLFFCLHKLPVTIYQKSIVLINKLVIRLTSSKKDFSPTVFINPIVFDNFKFVS